MDRTLYCASCGRQATSARETCTACGAGLHPEFRPAAGVLIRRDDRLLLIRRGGEPGQGRWDIPGGFLEPGETAEAAARREIREELGVELGPLQLVLSDINPLPAFTVLDLIYEGAIVSGEPRAASDAAAMAWFRQDDLPADLAFATTRRLLDRLPGQRQDAAYRLLAGSPLHLDRARTVARIEPGGAALPPGWHVECGRWRIHDGALCGSVEGERPAVLWCDTPVAGDHAILFHAAAVPPHHNDLNCFWEGSGRLGPAAAAASRRNELPDGCCTIGGVGGWWDGLTGIERHPEGGLRACGRTLPIRPGETYTVCGGRRGGSDFLFVDGRLAVQLDEPGAPRRQASRVALATWNSHVHFHDVQVLQLAGGT